VIRGEASDADFAAHAATCADCAAEVRVWTELDALLRAGAPAADGDHPEPETLAAFVDAPTTLAAASREAVERHLASCRVCADEVGTLRRFDPTRLAMPAADVATPIARTSRGALARVLWHPAFAYALVAALLVPLLRDQMPRMSEQTRAVDARRELTAPARPAAPVAREPEAVSPPAAPALPKQKAPAQERAAADERLAQNAERRRDQAPRAPEAAGGVEADDMEGAPSLHDLAGVVRPPAAVPGTAFAPAAQPATAVIELRPNAPTVVSSAAGERAVRLRITPPADLPSGPLDVRVRARVGAREIGKRVTERADAIVVEIPARWLTPGDYVVTLTPAVPAGVLAESDVAGVATLGFTVRAPTSAEAER
jgi:hypothetical protein